MMAQCFRHCEIALVKPPRYGVHGSGLWGLGVGAVLAPSLYFWKV